MGAAEPLLDVIRSMLTPADLTDLARATAVARAGLDEQAFEAAWAEGRAMSPDDAIASAMEEAPHA